MKAGRTPAGAARSTPTGTGTGVTFEDPDGYRVVLQNEAWES